MPEPSPVRELIRAPKDWRDDPRKVADLGRWLENRCHFRTPEERWTFVEKIGRPANDALYEDMVREDREEEHARMFAEDGAREDEAFRDMQRRSSL